MSNGILCLPERSTRWPPRPERFAEGCGPGQGAFIAPLLRSPCRRRERSGMSHRAHLELTHVLGGHDGLKELVDQRDLPVSRPLIRVLED